MATIDRFEWYTKMLKLILSLLLTIVPIIVHAADYYVSQMDGDDSNNGLTPSSSFQSLVRVNSLNLSAGDRLFFKSGETWQGMLWPKGSGVQNNPIIISSYGNGERPKIDGDGYQASILLYNDDNYVISGLELTNQASHNHSNGVTKKLNGFGGCENSWGSGRDARFGIKVVANSRNLSQFTFSDLLIHNIFPTPTSPEETGISCVQQGYNTKLKNQGYGIKFESQSNASSNLFYTISNVIMDNISVSETGHYGVWIKPLGLATGSEDYKHSNIVLRNSSFINTGGAGFVPTKASNVLIENNTFDGTGSTLDSRMYGRGSGTWVFDCQDVVIEKNILMNAAGSLDSYGVHIDYDNTNVLVQYNFSYNNEGGFVQILGDNVNSGYRYNIRVADGSRINGINGAVQNGRIFNVSGYCGINSPCQSSGSFIYNNTVYVPSTIRPEIVFQSGSGQTKFYNNLIYAEQGNAPIATSLPEQGSQYDISHNLFYPQGAFLFDQPLTQNAIYTDPKLQQLGASSAARYKLLSGSSAKYAGAIISGSLDPSNYSQNNGGFDFFGNPVMDDMPPHIGAYNANELLAAYSSSVEIPVLIFPFSTLLAVMLITTAIRHKKDRRS